MPRLKRIREGIVRHADQIGDLSGTEERGAWDVRNIWKGLIVGGLTGAAAGAVLDLFDRGARLVGVAG